LFRRFPISTNFANTSPLKSPFTGGYIKNMLWKAGYCIRNDFWNRSSKLKKMTVNEFTAVLGATLTGAPIFFILRTAVSMIRAKRLY